jgi:hypothetical protein
VRQRSKITENEKEKEKEVKIVDKQPADLNPKRSTDVAKNLIPKLLSKKKKNQRN